MKPCQPEPLLDLDWPGIRRRLADALTDYEKGTEQYEEILEAEVGLLADSGEEREAIRRFARAEF